MLHRKMKLFALILFCAVMVAGVSAKIHAQDNQDNNAATDSKPQIPATLIARWQQEAAQGNADAQFLLGNAYYTGNGVDQDYTQAIDWWKKAAAQGNVSAQRALDQLVPK
jgi:TPR repeat protein